MANEDRLKVKITKSGYQAAIDNSRDANGFKIKISKADVYDDKNNLRGTFDVVGKNIGQQQIALRIAVVDKTTSYGIKTIKLIDKYSGVEFAIISHPAGEMIDYINPHKIAYITCNLIITSLDDHTVTIIDSSTADADMGMIDGQFAEIRELIGKLPGVNLPGNQDTSGNAATATKLQNAACINGIPFDGSKDINATPAGAVQFFAMDTAPVGWLKANGAAVSRTSYASLYAAIGTRFGAGDGKTTFNLPDLRGEFLRAYDDGRGIDKGRAIGSEQGDSIRNITGKINVVHRGGGDNPVSSGALFHSSYFNAKVAAGGDDEWGAVMNIDASRVVPTSTENRPRNIALLACIKI